MSPRKSPEFKMPEQPADGGTCVCCDGPRRGDLCVTIVARGVAQTIPVCANCALFPEASDVDRLLTGMTGLAEDRTMR